jgi:hypothetical protein
MFFKKVNKEDKTEDKITKLEADLKKTKEELKNLIESRFFENEYPNGEIIQLRYFFSGIMGSDKNICYKFSDGTKLVELPITYLVNNLFEYKILVYNDTVYIAVKSENEEEYFVVDKQSLSVVQIKNDSFSEMVKIKWTKVNK